MSPDRFDLLAGFGALLVVFGVALVSVPGAMIVLGVLVVVVAIMGARADADIAESGRENEPDAGTSDRN